ncbi:hypothetical protein C8F01DRAFT_1093829 [Mycena amicta]|nr:hypothetical protein C8F01DRAFT_1093829 [Mycena amicta]
MPTLLELGRLRAAAVAAQAASSSSQGSDLPPSSPSRLLSPGPDDDLPPATSLIASARQLKRAKLGPGPERDYLQLCETTNPHERQNLSDFAVFNLISKVEHLTELIEKSQAEGFKKNSEVNGSFQQRAMFETSVGAFLASPDVHFYAGNITLVVIDAMRKEKVANIPGKNARTATKDFEAAVGHQLSVDRASIKAKLDASMKPDADPESTDIASVTSSILASWGLDIPLTLKLLWRMALIRTQLASDSGREFWSQLDKQLQELRSDKDAGVYIYALQENFKADTEKYGSISTLVSLDPDVGPHSAKWIQRVAKMAPTVLNVKATNPKARVNVRKRTHNQANDNSGDDEPEGAGNQGGDPEDEGPGQISAE